MEKETNYMKKYGVSGVKPGSGAGIIFVEGTAKLVDSFARIVDGATRLYTRALGSRTGENVVESTTDTPSDEP